MTDWSTLFFAKGGSIALMFGISVAIVVLLRFLYGPSGVFRSSTWSDDDTQEVLREHRSTSKDYTSEKYVESQNNLKENATHPPHLQNNEEQRAKNKPSCVQPQNASILLEQKTWFKEHIKKFTAYSNSFFTKDATTDLHLELKYEHTLDVVTNAQYIISNEPLFTDEILSRACLLAALYHDVGRFLQFTKYHTFSDALSCDHGYLSAQIITRELFLHTELPTVQHLTKLAVALHNKHTVNPCLPKEHLAVLKAVRDADKLDIFRIMANNLGKNRIPDPVVVMHLQNTPGQYSPAILEHITTGKPPSFLDMRYVNDFRLLLCSWVNDLHFTAARQKTLQDNYLTSIIEGLEGLDDIKPTMHAYVAKKLTTDL